MNRKNYNKNNCNKVKILIFINAAPVRIIGR